MGRILHNPSCHNYLITLLLILLMAGTAGAVQVYETDGDLSVRKVRAGDGVTFKETEEGYEAVRVESNTDRFLSTVIQPEIEAGDRKLADAKPGSLREYQAMCHYLRALVLLEQEKMRRGK